MTCFIDKTPNMLPSISKQQNEIIDICKAGETDIDHVL